MEIQKLNCASCGGPLDIPTNSEFITCPFCHAKLAIKRDEGDVTLKIIEQFSQTVQQTGTATQTVIRDGTQVTQSELKRLQISQDLSMVQLQLNSVQSEIRSLQRGKIDKVVSEQLFELRNQEQNIIQRMKILQDGLMPSATIIAESNTKIEQFYKKDRKPISGWIPLFIGGPLLICGILLFLLFVFSQITNEAGITDNLSGFIGALIICPSPFIIFGIILLIIGVIMVKKNKNENNQKESN